ncbi:hypothetical protein HPP92_025383 [Vanilla planifolia]|uniref:N-acetyltransferase domain-containing protein n=1 Tax=Vanilla planifolia TaxID=51239 RepID=A0A835PLU6_VANPL|nr:hypothetical protein HPP92_025383 [Vanilla planifolia]
MFMLSAYLSSPSLFLPSTGRRVPYSYPFSHVTLIRTVVVSKGVALSHLPCSSGPAQQQLAVTDIRDHDSVAVDLTFSAIKECLSDAELRAAVSLRIRTFYNFKQSFGVEDYKRYLIEREYEALKERIAGKWMTFKRVSCINVTIPVSPTFESFYELYSSCKVPYGGNEHIVVGTLDVNQCFGLADEIIGKKPEGSGSDLRRAYLSNLCVAKELHRNGLGYALVSNSKIVARQWGVTDLYVHVAKDNEAAQRLYDKCGFVYENEEPAWQARFLGRPQRFLLWFDLREENL